MRILIAEDDPVSRRLLERTLTKWGYEVVVACDGTQAWDILQRDDAPRLVVLDWMMPGMHGVQVCHEVRNRNDEPYTYILLLTAKSQKSDLIEGMDAGADDYLTKPFDANELKVRIRAGQRILELQEELISAREALRSQAIHDPLTGLFNRGAILDSLRRELARVARDGSPMSVVMVDLDHFKPVNDNYGHLVGDEVLVEVSTRIADSCRPYDLVGRYGGDEFLIVVPGVNASGATSLSCRVRRNICGLPIVVGENELRISASLGVAQALVSDDSETLENLISRADSAAYRAKSLGRNRVCAYESNISVSDPEEVTPAAV